MGAALVGWSAVAALVVSFRPGPNALDRFGHSLIAADPHSRLLLDVTGFATRPVLVLGSLLAAFLVMRRDSRRTLACLVGPILAAGAVEYVVKPLVGRHYVGVLSFPSGSVAATTALATAIVLAVPTRFRAAMAGACGLVVALMSYAVVALRWHYPSDVMAGVVFGLGAMLLIDGSLHLLLPRPPGARMETSRQT